MVRERGHMVLTSIFVLILRFTLSINTSNSSRHRNGDPMASQIDKSRQMDENDFSPPESVLVLRPAAELLVSSGSTVMSSRNRFGSMSRVPRKPRSASRYRKCMRERAVISLWNVRYRFRRCCSVDDSSCCISWMLLISAWVRR